MLTYDSWGVFVPIFFENIGGDYILNNNEKDITLKIKEEQIDIAKKWIKTGEVNIYRKSFMEEKNFTIPITREELIIEKKILNKDSPENKNMPVENIHIILSEDRVEFTKHRVDLEDVSIYKQQIEEIKHIEQTLKKEKAKINFKQS